MNGSNSFIEQMRRQAGCGVLWSDIKWSLLSLAVGAFGVSLIFVPDSPPDPRSGLLGAALLVAAATGMFFIVRREVRRRSPAGDPLNVQLAAFGEFSAVARDIDADFAGRPFAARRLQVGQRWLCYAGKGQVTVCRLDRLVWSYTERIRHRLNWVIPYRPASYQILLWDRNGNGTAVPVRKRDATPALAALQKAASWPFIGYSEALKESWNVDRREFLAVVESRRQQASGGPIGASGAD